MSDQTACHSRTLIGQTVSHYRIVEKLGGGGMGVVYKAEDTRLDRIVAIKFLPEETASDQEALRRFRREARAASALNHPNICTVHDIGEHEGQPFIVMECMEGQTLKQFLDGGLVPTSSPGTPTGTLPTNQLLELAIQITDALNAAHAKGIIHRDIKPGNIFITHQGQVKILDFGLAKVTAGKQQAGPSEDSRELQTGSGVVAGTVQYMSPEQTLGQSLDGRSDLFSFGAVLYEMATGRRPFPGSTISETIAHILYSQPEGLTQFDNHVPPELKGVIRKCLEKQPADRYQSVKDLSTDLQRLKRDVDAGRPLSSSSGRVVAVLAAGRKRWKVLVSAAVVLTAAVIGGMLYFRSGRTATRLTDKDTIVLSDFINKTGDAVFDDTLKQGLAVQLQQSPFLALLSERRINETLKLMGRPAGDHLTPEVTREVCLRAGSTTMLTGSIVGLGSQYVISLKAVNCNTGDVLGETQEQAARKDTVLKSLDTAAISLRARLGESSNSVQKYATPLADVTTSSLEALQAYSLGQKNRYAKGDAAALPFFRRAVELDPNFATAYASLSSVYWDLNEDGQAADIARKAYELRQRVSERERFRIEANYYLRATGEFEKAAQTFELWQQTYPRDENHMGLGKIFFYMGNGKKAVEEYKEVLHQEPNNRFIYYNLGQVYLALDRLDEAEAVYRQGQESKLEDAFMLRLGYWLAFLKGDAAQMARLVSSAIGKPGAEDLLLGMQADTEGWYGKLKTAHELTVRAMNSAQHRGAKEAAALHQADAAEREAKAGNREQALDDAHAALKLAGNDYVWRVTALALARAGATAEAEKLAADLDKTFPLNTMVQRHWLPTIRAQIALMRQQPNRAIEFLEQGNPTTFGAPVDFTTCMCTNYLRGEAYLMLHDGNRAATEFHKFIDHRTYVVNAPEGALARLGLARAYAFQGDRTKARAAYQDFLTIWKDADPDIPILKQAKSEYAKLQ